MSARKTRLVDCNPRWVMDNGVAVGVRFDCPEGHDNCLIGVPFTPALDGTAPSSWFSSGLQWQRTGDTFDALTLSPSILMHPARAADGHVVDACALHIFVKNGAIEFCGDSR